MYDSNEVSTIMAFLDLRFLRLSIAPVIESFLFKGLGDSTSNYSAKATDSSSSSLDPPNAASAVVVFLIAPCDRGAVDECGGGHCCGEAGVKVLHPPPVVDLSFWDETDSSGL